MLFDCRLPPGRLLLTLTVWLVAWPALARPQFDLVPFGSDWEWLHPLDGMDPETFDADFAETWHRGPPVYDGPAFEEPAPAILGFGGIAYGSGIVTDIGEPVDGDGNVDPERNHAAYFRRTFVLPADHPADVFAELLADDGAWIYVDGRPGIPVNIRFQGGVVDPDSFYTWNCAAAGVWRTETATRTVYLGRFEPGTHTIGVSVHQNLETSTDLGFDMRIYASEQTETEILPFGSSWEWLHPPGIDPGMADPDFADTWFLGGPEYDGPDFEPAAPGILGFGTIDWSPGVVTDIGFPFSPAENNAVYFRRSFTIPEGIGGTIMAELLADDGAWVYVDRLPPVAVNIRERNGVPDPDSYLTDDCAAGSPADTEVTTRRIILGNFEPGTTHTVGVSVHQSDPFSADLGFDMRIYAGEIDRGVPLTQSGVFTGFQEASPGMTSFFPGDGQSGLSWSAAGGSVQEDPNGGDGNLTFRVSVTDCNPFRTGPVDVSGAATFKVSVKLRAYTLDSSGFDSASDRVRVFVEVSRDGVLFAPVSGGEPVPLTTGALTLPDPILEQFGPGIPGYNPNPAPYVERSVVILNSGYVSARLVIAAATDHPAEILLFDDIRFSLPECRILPEVIGMTRDEGGDADPANDTWTAEIRITNEDPFRSGWISPTDPAHPAGEYGGEPVVFGPYPASGGPVELEFHDAEGGCGTLLQIIPPPAPQRIGVTRFGGVPGPPIRALPGTAWRIDPDVPAIVQTNGRGGRPHVLVSEPVPLQGASGPVTFTMTFTASEDSGVSNFETLDRFRAELILDDGGPGAIMDLTAALDTDGSGYVNGCDDLPDFPYDPFADEFNSARLPAEDPVESTFILTATIPDNVLAVTLRIAGVNDSASERFRITDMELSDRGLPADQDRDGDGATDADEGIAGTDPDDPDSVLRLVLAGPEGSPPVISGRFPSVAGRFYRVYRSGDLQVWTPVTGETLTGTGGELGFSVPAGPARSWFRVMVSRSDGPWP